MSEEAPQARPLTEELARRYASVGMPHAEIAVRLGLPIGQVKEILTSAGTTTTVPEPGPPAPIVSEPHPAGLPLAPTAASLPPRQTRRVLASAAGIAITGAFAAAALAVLLRSHADTTPAPESTPVPITSNRSPMEELDMLDRSVHYEAYE